MTTSLFQSVDDQARSLAHQLLSEATFAALAVTDPDSPAPFLSRVALALDASGTPVSLVSQLAQHTRALQANPNCALLLGEPGPKGDVLSHPRLTYQAQAEFVASNSPAHVEMAAQYLRSHPKAKLYLSLGDFGFVRFLPRRGFLNGGFGKAFQLGPKDLIA
jgi:putative heme iron utilization protein